METEETKPEINVPHHQRTGLAGMMDKNRKMVTYLLGGIIIVILGFFGFKQFYLEPQEAEARVKLFKAQRLAENDSTLTLALNGKGMDMGFIAIADDYGMTKSGNLAHYYAGCILLKQGKYDDAISHLKSFSSKSKVFGPLALGAIGDAYCQQKNFEEAADYYMKAAHKDDNRFTAPRYFRKAGLVYEELKKYKEALEAYQVVKDKYANTNEGNQIDKYIGRAQAHVDAE
ncbi:MAG: tetratricopeptide repeat protein [Bacteroidetes bacterium]|nr:tetratricopeptide repeat protein [Bacteroidota bacterium]